MGKKVFVIAGTGFPEIIRIAEDFCEMNPSFEFLGFIDDNLENSKRELYGYPLLGGFTFIENNRVLVANSIARNCRVRAVSTARLKGLGASFMNLIHPTAIIDTDRIGIGNIVDRGSIIHRGTSVGSHNVLLSNVIFGHDTVVGDLNFFGHKTTLNGFVKVGNSCYLGGHSIIAPSVEIRDNSTVGMACAVTFNLPPESRIVARPPVQLS